MNEQESKLKIKLSANENNIGSKRNSRDLVIAQMSKNRVILVHYI